MVSAGMDFENPRPLHVFVGVLTSVTTGFFNIALGNGIESRCVLNGNSDREQGFLNRRESYCSIVFLNMKCLRRRHFIQ